MWIVTTSAEYADSAERRPGWTRRGWRLWGVADYIFVVRRWDLLPEEAPVFDPHYDLILEPLLRDPIAQRDLLEMYESVSGHEVAPMTRRFGYHSRNLQLGHRLEEAFHRGDLVLLVAKRRGVQGAEAPGQEEAAGGTAPETQTKKTWIEFQLVDADSRPVPNERYHLVLSDGTVQDGSLDENGLVRVEEIDPGTCKISFPDIHAAEWKAA